MSNLDQDVSDVLNTVQRLETRLVESTAAKSLAVVSVLQNNAPRSHLYQPLFANPNSSSFAGKKRNQHVSRDSSKAHSVKRSVESWTATTFTSETTRSLRI